MNTCRVPALAPLILGILCGAFNAFGQAVSNSAPRISEEFTRPWGGATSPDGLFRINGPWPGTAGNLLDPTLATISEGEQGRGGMLSLSVAPAAPGQTPYRGSEIQSHAGATDSKDLGYGFGYYETAMKVTDVPGVCASFFWIEAPGYGPHEWDIEFLTNEPWINSSNDGQVHLTLHPSNTTYILRLPFNPSQSFHRYGFLWTQGQIVFTVDSKPAHTFTEPDLKDPVRGFMMANTTTGQPNWGGGPPARKATSNYLWMKYTPGVTAIPAW